VLYWALIFFLVALVASIFGFGQIAQGAETIAMWLFWIFLICFIIALIMGLARRSGK
jgi:uncharacterized membrane protein YtjA (UPF0391 family)